MDNFRRLSLLQKLLTLTPPDPPICVHYTRYAGRKRKSGRRCRMGPTTIPWRSRTISPTLPSSFETTCWKGHEEGTLAWLFDIANVLGELRNVQGCSTLLTVSSDIVFCNSAKPHTGQESLRPLLRTTFSRLYHMLQSHAAVVPNVRLEQGPILYTTSSEKDGPISLTEYLKSMTPPVRATGDCM